MLGKALTNSVVLASYFSSLALSVFILKQTLEVRCGGMCSQSNLLEGCSKRIGFKVIFDLIKSWLKTKTLKYLKKKNQVDAGIGDFSVLSST